MIFTGYIDESDTHGSTPDMTLAAMLSSAGRWERCGRRLKAIQSDFGFSIFHGTTFAALKGEFEGWSRQKCYDLLMAFGSLVANHVTECVTVSCEYEVYKKHFLDVRPAKMHQTSQYGICFLAMLDALSKVVAAQGPQHKLSVVIEDGHTNATDTRRLFDERKGRLEKAGVDFLRSHSLFTKKQCPLLMLADITSHGHALEQRAVRSGDAPNFAERNEREPRRGETGWTIYEVTPGYLAALIEEFNSGRVAVHQDYLRRKQAWLNAKQAVEG
jgi:hypothetical protein